MRLRSAGAELALLLLLALPARAAEPGVPIVSGLGDLEAGSAWSPEQIVRIARRWPDRYLNVFSTLSAYPPGGSRRTETGYLVDRVRALPGGEGVRWAFQFRFDVVVPPFAKRDTMARGENWFCRRDAFVCSVVDFTRGTGGADDRFRCEAADFGAAFDDEFRGMTAWIEKTGSTGTLHPLAAAPLPPLLTSHAQSGADETLRVERFDWAGSSLGREPKPGDTLYLGGRGCTWPDRNGDAAGGSYDWSAWAWKVDRGRFQARLDEQFDVRPWPAGDGRGETPFAKDGADCCNPPAAAWQWIGFDVDALLAALPAGRVFDPHISRESFPPAQPSSFSVGSLRADVCNADWQEYAAWYTGELLTQDLRVGPESDVLVVVAHKAMWHVYYDGEDSGLLCGDRGRDGSSFSAMQPARDCGQSDPRKKWRSPPGASETSEGPIADNPYTAGQYERCNAELLGAIQRELHVRRGLHGVRVAGDNTASAVWVAESAATVGAKARGMLVADAQSRFRGASFYAGEIDYASSLVPNAITLQNEGRTCGASPDGSAAKPDLEVCIDPARSLDDADGSWSLWCDCPKHAGAGDLAQLSDADACNRPPDATSPAKRHASDPTLAHDFGAVCGERSRGYTPVVLLVRDGFPVKAVRSFTP